MLQFVMVVLMFCAPQEDERLLSAVPSQAQMLVSIQNLGELKETLMNSAWGRFFQDPELKTLFDRIAETIDLDIDLELEEELAGLSPWKLLDAISGPLVLFAEIRDLEEENFGFGILVEPGEDRDGFDEYVTAFKDFLYKEEKITDFTDSYDDVELIIFESAEEDREEGRFVLANLEDVSVLVGHYERDRALEMAHNLIDALNEGQDGETLLDSSGFQNTRNRGGGPSEVEVFVDLESILSMMLETWQGNEEDPLPPEATKILSLLRLDDISSFYFCGEPGSDENMKASFYLGIEGEGGIRGLVDCFMGEAPLDFMKAMPKDAAGVSAGYFDINGIYKKATEDLWAKIHEESYNQARAVYDEMIKERLGIDPEKELLGLLDGRLGSFSMKVPEEEASFLEALNMASGMEEWENSEPYGEIYLIGVRDAGTFQSNFEKMLRAFGVYVTMKKEDFQGHMIYSIQLPFAGMRLYWVFSEDCLGLSFFPTSVRSFVRLLSHQDQPTLKDRRDFSSLISRYQEASSLSVAETPLVVKGFLMGMLGMIKNVLIDMEEGEDMASDFDLPAIKEEWIHQYFNGVMGNFLEVDEKGAKLTVVCQ